MMTRHSAELELLRQQRFSHDPPLVDVSARVAKTIAVQLVHRHRATARTMAVCSVLGVATAVAFASAAWLLQTRTAAAESPVTVILDAYGVNVDTFLTPASDR